MRGKAEASVEVVGGLDRRSVNLVDRYTRIEHMQWTAFSKGQGMQGALEACRKRYDCDPEAVLVDKM